MDRAFAVLKDAKRPVILAGNGAIRKRASKRSGSFAKPPASG